MKENVNKEDLKKILSLKKENILFSIAILRKLILIIINCCSDVYSYSYCVKNISSDPMEITLDFTAKSKNLFYVPSSGRISKIVNPGETEFMMHCIADP